MLGALTTWGHCSKASHERTTMDHRDSGPRPRGRTLPQCCHQMVLSSSMGTGVSYIWVEIQKIGVEIPQNGWFIDNGENPINPWDDLGGRKPHYFRNAIHMVFHHLLSVKVTQEVRLTPLTSRNWRRLQSSACLIRPKPTDIGFSVLPLFATT